MRRIYMINFESPEETNPSSVAKESDTTRTESPAPSSLTAAAPATGSPTQSVGEPVTHPKPVPIPSLLDRISNLQGGNTSEPVDLSSLIESQDDETASLKTQISDLQEEVKTLSEDFERAQSDVRKYHQQLVAEKEAHSATITEKEELTEKINHLNASLQESDQNRQDVKRALLEEQKRHQQTKRQMAALEEQLKLITQHCEPMIRKLEERQGRRASLTTSDSSLDSPSTGDSAGASSSALTTSGKPMILSGGPGAGAGSKSSTATTKAQRTRYKSPDEGKSDPSSNLKP